MKTKSFLTFFIVLFSFQTLYAQQASTEDQEDSDVYYDPQTVKQAICILDGMRNVLDKGKSKMKLTRDWGQAEAAMLQAVIEFNEANKSGVKKVVLVTGSYGASVFGAYLLFLNSKLKEEIPQLYFMYLARATAGENLAKEAATLLMLANKKGFGVFKSLLKIGKVPYTSSQIQELLKLLRQIAMNNNDYNGIRYIDKFEELYPKASAFLAGASNEVVRKIIENDIHPIDPTSGFEEFSEIEFKANELDRWIMKEQPSKVRKAVVDLNSESIASEIDKNIVNATEKLKFKTTVFPKRISAGGKFLGIAGLLFGTYYLVYGDKPDTPSTLLETNFLNFDKNQFTEFLSERPDLVKDIIKEDIFSCAEYVKHAKS